MASENLSTEEKYHIERFVSKKLRSVFAIIGIANILIAGGVFYSIWVSSSRIVEQTFDKRLSEKVSERFSAVITVIESEIAFAKSKIDEIQLDVGEASGRTKQINTGITLYENQLSKLRTLIQDAETDNLLKLVTLLDKTDIDVIESVRADIASLQNLTTNLIRECRFCFQEIEGSDQCQKERNSCTEWSSINNKGQKWTAPFRDDTDNRGGGCTYQWAVECR